MFQNFHHTADRQGLLVAEGGDVQKVLAPRHSRQSTVTPNRTEMRGMTSKEGWRMSVLQLELHLPQ